MLKNLLDEIKGFRYQITVKVLLKKIRGNGDIEFAPVYFDSAAKIVIYSKYMFDQSSHEILYRIDNWVNEGSGWIIESMDGEFFEVSNYSPLTGSSYIELTVKLRH